MNQLLLVEGKDDLHVFSNIFKNNGVNECFEIVDKEGIDKLLGSLPILIKTDVQAIGIIVDADENINSRWGQLSTILIDSGYEVPKTIPKQGLIIDPPNENGLPKVGVWIMPDNNQDGSLEDFVKQLIPDEDKLLPYVDKSLDEIEGLELNKYKIRTKRTKARIHTWLSWQEDPGTPMGLAITKKYLIPKNKLCMSFLSWIRTLFVTSNNK